MAPSEAPRPAGRSAPKRIRGKTRSDLLTRYRDRVETARRWRKNEGYDKLWERCIELYKGKHFDANLLPHQDRIAVNVTFSTINTIVPGTSVNDPKLVVLAQKNEDDVKARTVEAALNYWWRRYEYQPEVALAVKDALVIGHGWVKVGWRYVEETKDREREARAAAGPNADDPATTPEDKSDSPAEDEDSSSTDNEREFEVTEDRPFAERVSFKDMLVDPDAKTLREAKWIAQKTVVPLAQLRQDERYREAGRRAAIPDCHQAGCDDDDEDLADDIQRVTVWEFYDMQLGTMCAFPEQGKELLLDPEPQPYNFGHPFIMLRGYEVPDEFYPMGEVEALEPLQEELNKTRSQLMNHRKRYDRKYVYRRHAFDAQARAALESDRDNVMVPVDTDEPLQDLVLPVPINAVDPQLYQYADGLLPIFDRVSGVTEFEQGQMPDIRHTATEAAMINDASNSRAADKLRNIEKFMGRIAERTIQLAQQYLTQDQEARILGPNGHHVWVPLGREQVKGDFDFFVEAGSTKPLNESQRRSQALQLMQTMMPLLQTGMINVQEVIRYVLSMGFGVKEPDKFMVGAQPQQSGEQQKPPHQTMIESINYKDAPPDVQRQMEQMAGLQPSQVGGSSPAEQGLAKAIQPHIQQAATGPQQQQQSQQQMLMEAAKAQAQEAQLHAKHIHEASMQHEDHRHDHAMGLQQQMASQQQAEQQHGHALEQQDQAQQGQMAQQIMGAAMQPEEPETTATEE